jgi:catechol 2,3-dioxygenase-like lactoylglutathione lyase family enzyme
MKRMHIHMFIDDLQKSINFYSNLFGSEPTKRKDDYAKWMLNDPGVNFAISSRGSKSGIDHLGIQVEKDIELKDMRERLKKADMQTFAEGETVCCYAKSDKTWVEDPSGIAWETYRTMEDAEVFNNSSDSKTSDIKSGTCC